MDLALDSSACVNTTAAAHPLFRVLQIPRIIFHTWEKTKEQSILILSLGFTLDQANFRPEIWQTICQHAAEADVPTGAEDDDSILPVYEPPVGSGSRSGLNTLLTRGDRSLDGGLPSALPSSISTLYYPQSFLRMEPDQTCTYTYNLYVNNVYLQIFILVESEPDRPNHYTFSLSMKVGHVERALSSPVTMKLSIDPRRLDFVVFVFPPRSSLPAGCLYHLRVWLRTAGADHRMFAERDLWFGKDPDFLTIADASFASLRNATQDMSIYQGIVGRAHVSFIFRWTSVEPGTYGLSLDYEAGGAGRTLFENLQLRLYCDPQLVSFLIYTVPVPSFPAGASHRLRIWIRTPHAAPYPLPSDSSTYCTATTATTTAASTPTESYDYQRLWKSDDFKIGAHLAFEGVPRIVLATPGGTVDGTGTDSGINVDAGSDAVTHDVAHVGLARNGLRRVSRLVTPALDGSVDDAGETVDDC